VAGYDFICPLGLFSSYTDRPAHANWFASECSWRWFFMYSLSRSPPGILPLGKARTKTTVYLFSCLRFNLIVMLSYGPKSLASAVAKLGGQALSLKRKGFATILVTRWMPTKRPARNPCLPGSFARVRLWRETLTEQCKSSTPLTAN
jgi:hypothetical protein